MFGSDLPIEGGKGVNFAWRDGPLLRALKNGDWVLLDEVGIHAYEVSSIPTRISHQKYHQIADISSTVL